MIARRRDTDGAMCIFELTGTTGGPRHLHHHQDEWLYIVHGELELEVGSQQRPVRAGEGVRLPRKGVHGWSATGDKPVRIVKVYQPAGQDGRVFPRGRRISWRDAGP